VLLPALQLPLRAAHLSVPRELCTEYT
jgi:hypothetical protein